ncbi:MAG: hypothetical protein KAH96_06205 [Alphaproteobacteria bacterium]|nr:hypothetical protein [Alphaproteobacteria bacterium]
MSIFDLFNRCNPEGIENITNDPIAFKNIRVIGKRSLKLQKEAKEHCEKHRMKWINREAKKIFRENHETFKHILRPPWQVNDTPGDYIKAAKERVDLRIEGHLKNIGVIRDRMQRNVIKQSVSIHERRQELLNKDIKHINKLSIHKQRTIIEDFEKNKTQWVYKAKKSGAENPEVEVYSRYRQRINNIKSEQEHKIKQAHEKHGINYNPQNFLTQKFNHEM